MKTKSDILEMLISRQDEKRNVDNNTERAILDAQIIMLQWVLED